MRKLRWRFAFHGCVGNLQENEVPWACEMRSRREDGNTAALRGVLVAPQRKCVAPKVHATLARAVLLLCSVSVCLREVNGFLPMNGC